MKNTQPPGRWSPSRWSSTIFHARLKNYTDPDGDLVAELESDCSGAVYAVLQLRGEVFEVNEGEGMPGYPAAAHAALKAMQHLFQSRRRNALVLQFLPFKTQAEYKRAFGVAQSTTSTWRNFKTPMARRYVQQAMTLIGFKMGRNIELGPPAWSSDFDEKGE